MGTSQDLVDRLLEAGRASGEKLWQLPLFEESRQENRSTWADLRNIGGPNGASLSAAWFVGEFARGAEWAHLDVRGTAILTADPGRGYLSKGATGVPVRTLVNCVLALSGLRA